MDGTWSERPSQCSASMPVALPSSLAKLPFRRPWTRRGADVSRYSCCGNQVGPGLNKAPQAGFNGFSELCIIDTPRKPCLRRLQQQRSADRKPRTKGRPAAARKLCSSAARSRPAPSSRIPRQKSLLRLMIASSPS